MTRKGILVSVALLVTFGNLNANDELAITELYGQAVHAYFDGEFKEAHKYLTDAIELGTDDPRVYYFRGLSKMRLGRNDEAKSDFAEGGKLEASGPAQFYPIGRSLERIQGTERVAIEKVRKQARIAIRLKKKKIEQARIEGFKRDERLRGSASGVQLSDPSANSKSDEDPFGTAGNAAPKTETLPATKDGVPPSKAGDPFSAPKKAEPPKTGGDDPFAAPKKAEPPKTGGDDPFGAPKKAEPPKTGGDDPFAAPKKAEPPKTGGDDPFAAPKKSTGGDDPFASPKKGTEPANDDPFASPNKSTGSEKKSEPDNNPDPFAGPSGTSGEKKSEEKKSDDPFK